MIYYGLWWGGSSYSPPEIHDLEEFASLAVASDTLWERYAIGTMVRSEFRYVFRETERVFCPAVNEQTEILLYRSPDDLDYPIKRIFIGPRGGIRVENT